jgi:lipoprotein-anchoring transpeptidase ErfK/SrfK
MLLACAFASPDLAGASPEPAGAEVEPPAKVGSDSPQVDPDPFTAWLDAPIPVASGFSAPFAGEPCGEGCWRSTRVGKVRAIADGVVRAVGEGTVETEHLWYDDQVRRSARVRWEGVNATVAPGARVVEGEVLGTGTEVRLLSEVGPMTTFIAGRPRLVVPQAERTLAIISHDVDRLRLYAGGKELGTYEVGFGQAEGDKERRGDNRTPKGVYHVVARSTGPFSGPVAEYYGGYWIKLNYPNPWDAARGVDEGLFDVEVQRLITRAWWARELTLQGTKLGGGIGLHGWAYEWEDAGGRGMSWGCVVMHLRDAPTLFEHLVEGTMVALI